MTDTERQRQLREQAAQMANQAGDAAKQLGAAASSVFTGLFGSSSNAPEDNLFTWSGPSVSSVWCSKSKPGY